jgi:2'-5' RNA ligase
MEKIRSFIAIELPGEVKQALDAIEEKLKTSCNAPVRWVDPASIHLTLKFLGDIDSGTTGDITAALEAAAGGIHPFSVTVSGLGVFPNPQRVQVVWVGLAGEPDKLNQLQKRIDTALVPLGFKAEGRPFTPHLTLGRVRDYAAPDAIRQLGQFIGKTAFDAKCAFKVNAVHLIRSQLTRESPIHTIIGTVQLK